MENIVLYRKYRPQRFSDIIGQDHIVQTLQNALGTKAFSHAYLFTGPRGSGKTTIARLLAKAINCAAPKGGEPCNQCDSCLEITDGRSLDIMEIDAASHTGVDQVRELISGLAFAPVKSPYKIFIIDECHQLSKAAANALLKTLEEPPAHAIFILATTEAHKVLATIVSRCQRFDFRRLQVVQMLEKLESIVKKEGIKVDKKVLTLVAQNARGSLRDAESILGSCITFTGQDKVITLEEVKALLGVVEVSQVSALVDLLLAKNAKEAVGYIAGLIDLGVDLQEFAKALVLYARRLLLVKVNPQLLKAHESGLSSEEFEIIQRQTETLSEKQVQYIVERFIEAEQAIRYASIVQLPLELAIVDIALGS